MENEKPLKQNFTVNDMDLSDRPRERMISFGPDSLANYELLAILLRTGTKGENVIDLSKRLLAEHHGIEGLKSITIEDLLSVDGIKAAKATQVLAAVELGRRFASVFGDNKRQKISNPEEVYKLLHYEMESLDHEELWVICLDSRHCIIDIDKLYRGSSNTSTVRVAEIFKTAVVKKAQAIILAHNHPSGDSRPSASDIVTTSAVKEAGKTMEIPVLDHIIIGKGNYTSINSFVKE